MINKLLVAIDESQASQCAFEMALQFARALDAELTLVHVLDIFSEEGPGNPFVWVGAGSVALDVERIKTDYAAKMAQFVGRYEALLGEKQAEAKRAGVLAHTVQPQGRPGPMLCQVAKENHIDLIVMGNRDRATLKELVPGSVSNYVLHRAPCSVTVVYPDGKASE